MSTPASSAADFVFVDAHHDAARVDLVDHAAALGGDGDARVARHRALDAGTDQRRLRTQRRHGLALHVRAHQRAVRVVVLEERHQRRRDRHGLHRRDVHEVDFAPADAARIRPGSGRTRSPR